MNNSFTLNSTPINFGSVSTPTAQDAIVFSGFSLQNTNFITSRLDYDNLGAVELNTFNFPRNDGGGVLSKYYRGRTITLKGIIKKDTVSEFNSFMDEVKKNLRFTEGSLEIIVNGEVRKIKATVTNLDYDREHYNITFSPIKVTFRALEPFFYAEDSQALTYEAKTGTFTDDFLDEGTAGGEPTMYLIFATGTTATGVEINDPTGRILTITSGFTAGDILLIDGENKTVRKNNVEIDYSGVFPRFEPGNNNFTVEFVGGVLVDVSIVIPKNYL